MCGSDSTDSAVTIKSNTTKEQDDARRKELGLPDAKPTDSANAFQDHQKRFQGFSVMPTAEAPDVTNDALRKRRTAEALQLLTGRGRKASFLSGDYSSGALGGASLSAGTAPRYASGGYGQSVASGSVFGGP